VASSVVSRSPPPPVADRLAGQLGAVTIGMGSSGAKIPVPGIEEL
jgi:hypothetical protein